MSESFYKKTTILLVLSGLFAFFQNCSHLQNDQKKFALQTSPIEVETSKNKNIQETKKLKPIKSVKVRTTAETVEHFKISNNISGLATAFDFNKDGVLDIIHNNSANSALEIYIRKNETYAHTVSLPTSAPSYAEVLTLDLNSDGHLDLVTASTGGVVNVWLDNKRPERYYERLDFNTSLGISGPVYSISSGDINNDGFIDIAVANTKNRLDGFVTILVNNGLGILSLKQIMIGEGLAPSQVDLVDLNSDGYHDLVFKSSTTNKIYIYKNEDNAFIKEVVVDFPENDSINLKQVAIREFNQKNKL